MLVLLTSWCPTDRLRHGLLYGRRLLAAMPPHAFALTKRHLAMEPQSLEEALEMEAMSQSLAFVGSELEEGRAAFLEKRKPDFR